MIWWSPLNATDFESAMFDCSRGDWLAIPGFLSRWSFASLKMVYFLLSVLWAYLRIQKFVLRYGKKGRRKHHSFPWWNFQQIPCSVAKVQGWVSGVCRIRQLPSFHLLAWLETGSYSFFSLNSLLAETCYFEWAKMIYKVQLSAANSIG